MFRAIALCQSLWRRAIARNVSFFILYGGQFTFSTQLLTLNLKYFQFILENLSIYSDIFDDLGIKFFTFVQFSETGFVQCSYLVTWCVYDYRTKIDGEYDLMQDCGRLSPVKICFWWMSCFGEDLTFYLFFQG